MPEEYKFNEKKFRHVSWGIVAILVVMTFSILFIVEGSGSKSKTQVQESVGVKYSGIYQKSKDYTEAQFAEYAKSLVGEHIEWTGSVYEVSTSGEMFLSMGESMLSTKDVSFKIQKDDATKYSKGEKVTVKGKIKNVEKGSFLREIVLDEAKIIYPIK
mgnify:CR=1 FL=1